MASKKGYPAMMSFAVKEIEKIYLLSILIK
jgi:hypothetical protein